MATRVVIAVACLPFPIEHATPLMRQFIGLLKNSPSWRVRLDVLLPLQSEYFSKQERAQKLTIFLLASVLLPQLILIR